PNKTSKTQPAKTKQESAEHLKTRTSKISSILRKTYQGMGTELHFKNPFELLIATILSAQCTDEKVNEVTPALFKAFGTPAKMAVAPDEKLREMIRQTGFFNQKAKSIKNTSAAIVERFAGKVPE